MIRLFTSYYIEQQDARLQEVTECLRRNLACHAIDRVYLLLESVEEPPLTHPKLETKRIARRPNYAEFFDWCNGLCPATNDLSIIANSDIYFDEDVRRLVHSMRPLQCAALARWNVKPDGAAELFDRNDSQDSWVFRGPIRSLECDYQIGVPRCDNRILYELKQAGYDVINPAFSIRSFHLHAGDREEYGQDELNRFVDPPYAYLWPHNLYGWPRTLFHNLTHPSDRIRWQVDRRWLASTLPARAARKLARVLGSRS